MTWAARGAQTLSQEADNLPRAAKKRVLGTAIQLQESSTQIILLFVKLRCPKVIKQA